MEAACATTFRAFLVRVHGCWLSLIFNLCFCLSVVEVQVGTCSQRSWTSAIFTGNTSEERQSTCHTLTERGKTWAFGSFYQQYLVLMLPCSVSILFWLSHIVSVMSLELSPITYWSLMFTIHWLSCFHSFRMNKNKFEEDDGIDMNDIERFLPHLRSVSHWFSLFAKLNASL